MEAQVKWSLKVDPEFSLKKSPYFVLERSSSYIPTKVSMNVRDSGLKDLIENIQYSFNWEWSIVARSAGNIQYWPNQLWGRARGRETDNIQDQIRSERLSISDKVRPARLQRDIKPADPLPSITNVPLISPILTSLLKFLGDGKHFISHGGGSVHAFVAICVSEDVSQGLEVVF